MVHMSAHVVEFVFGSLAPCRQLGEGAREGDRLCDAGRIVQVHHGNRHAGMENSPGALLKMKAITEKGECIIF